MPARSTRVPFAEAVAAGKVVICQDEVDAAYIAAVKAQALPGPRDLKIIYSPLHGVGASAVLPVLAADGFKRRRDLWPARRAGRRLSRTCPGTSRTRRTRRVFDAIIERGKAVGADLILATDPDCDRIGLRGAADDRSRRAPGARSPATRSAPCWPTTSSNAARRRGSLTPEHYVVKTLVTTEMIRRIADAYGVRTYGDLQVGFKWIGGTMDEQGPDKFVFGTEESHGYLVGSYARDKDAAVAAHAAGRAGGQGQSGRQDAAREARRAVLAARLPRRDAGLGDDARLAKA